MNYKKLSREKIAGLFDRKIKSTKDQLVLFTNIHDIRHIAFLCGDKNVSIDSYLYQGSVSTVCVKPSQSPVPAMQHQK